MLKKKKKTNPTTHHHFIFCYFYLCGTACYKKLIHFTKVFEECDINVKLAW